MVDLGFLPLFVMVKWARDSCSSAQMFGIAALLVIRCDRTDIHWSGLGGSELLEDIW